MRLTFIITCYNFYKGEKMYVCICNNLTSKKIQEAIKKGVCDYRNVYSFYNCVPKCGKCLEVMSEIVNDKENIIDIPNC